jgi:hypothetical protein
LNVFVNLSHTSFSFFLEKLDNNLNWEELGSIALARTKANTVVCFGGGDVVRREFEASTQRASLGADTNVLTFHWFPVKRKSADGTTTESCSLSQVPSVSTLICHPS